MSERRPPEQTLKRDIARAKARRNDALEQRDAAQADAERLSNVVRELSMEVVELSVRGRLRRIEDFYTFIGLEKVVDQDGRVVPADLNRWVSDLLRRRPELAAPALFSDIPR